MQKPLPHSHWRHYKSTGWEDYTYEVLGIAIHSETHEEMVIYKSLYDSREEIGKVPYEKGALFARPLSLWYNTVDWCGHKIQRFTQIF